MGGICNYPSIINENQLITEKNRNEQINFSKYESFFTSYFKDFESHNLLKNIHLSEYIYHYTNYKFENDPTSYTSDKKKYLFSENLNKADFAGFVRTKILVHPFSNLTKYSNTKDIFNSYLLGLYDYVSKCLTSYSKYCKEKGFLKLNDKKIKKYFLFAIGILLCKCEDFNRVDIFFNTFSNKSNELENDKNLELFLFILLFLPYYGSFLVLRNLNSTFPKEIALKNNDDYEKIESTYSVEISYNIVQMYLKLLFEDNSTLTYTKYLESFNKKGMDQIFTAEGIRYLLENKGI